MVGFIGNIRPSITENQCDWFGDRMTESATGRILIPTRLYDKFRKITGLHELSNQQVKSFLIDNCY